jgi:hypothetical protein
LEKAPMALQNENWTLKHHHGPKGEDWIRMASLVTLHRPFEMVAELMERSKWYNIGKTISNAHSFLAELSSRLPTDRTPAK